MRLEDGQSIYLLFDGSEGGEGWGPKINLVYRRDARLENALTNSIEFDVPRRRKGNSINERFYKFKSLQQQLNVANYLMLQLLRHFPASDPFYKDIEASYHKRFEEMTSFFETQKSEKPEAVSTKITAAYYVPEVPHWNKSDKLRDSILSAHYFDYFNPADSFYLNSNILYEKMNIFFNLSTHSVDAFGQRYLNEDDLGRAAVRFMRAFEGKIPENRAAFNYCLKEFLSMFDSENKHKAYLQVYDEFLSIEGEQCEIEDDIFEAFRERAGILRGIQVGNTAPDFEIFENTGNYLHQTQSDYTLLLFWASWCPHCHNEIYELKNFLDTFKINLQNQGKTFSVIAISLDTDKELWMQYIEENQMKHWVNISELKGWHADLARKYNIYATPTMFLLDRNKKILLNPISTSTLINYLNRQ